MSGILQVTILRYPEIVGGVDMMVSVLVSQLRRRHHVCVFVPGGWEQDRLVRRDADGVPVYALRLRLPTDGRRPWRGFLGWLAEFGSTVATLRSLVRRERIDLIHAHMALDHQIYLRVLRWIGGPPYVITLHRADVVEHPQLSPTRRFLVRFGLYGAARVNAVSGWLAARAEEVFPRCRPVSAIYNGLELPDSATMDGPIGVALSEPLPSRFAVMVGSFDPYKGHELALRAWGHILQQEPGLHLVVIGAGDLRPAYEALIAEFGCSELVHLIGEVPHDDVLRIVRRAEFMVFPSRNEGLGYVILEAGAAGVPVVCTRIPVFEEFITHDENGLLVPLDEPETLASAAVRLTRDSVLRARLGTNLRALVRERFSAQAMAAGYEALYQSVLMSQDGGDA